VSIGTVSGATIYYVVGTQGYVSPSLESQLKPGSWTPYTGPVTISANRKLIAVAVRNGQYSRINSGYFTINANAPTTTLTPVADTDTQSDVAAGTNTTLHASKWNTLFIKFNLSTLSGTVSSAKLRVYKNNTNAGTLNVNGAAPDSWTEGGAKPTLGSAIATATMGGTAGYIEIDVTGTVNAEAAGDDLVSFGLTTNLDGWTGFNSRENTANKPQLVVTYGSGARVVAEALDAALEVFPNPVKDGLLHVKVYAREAGTAVVSLAGTGGNRTLVKEYGLRQGQNLLKVGTGTLPSGLYVLSVQQGSGRMVKKVVVQ
jgi:hypothetical protein